MLPQFVMCFSTIQKEVEKYVRPLHPFSLRFVHFKLCQNNVRVYMKISSANGYLQAPAANFFNEYCSSSRNNPSSCKVSVFFQPLYKIK